MTFETKKLTQKVKGLLNQASVLAERYRQSELEPEHLLLVMLGQSGGDVPQMLVKLSVLADTVTDEVRQTVLRFPSNQGEKDLSISRQMQHLLMKAQEEANCCGASSITVEHVLLALLTLSRETREAQSGQTSNVGDILLSYGINREAVTSFFEQARSIRQTQQVCRDERETRKMPQTIIPGHEQEGKQTQEIPADKRSETQIIQNTQRTDAENPASQILSPGFKKWKASQTLKADEDLTMWQTQAADKTSKGQDKEKMLQTVSEDGASQERSISQTVTGDEISEGPTSPTVSEDEASRVQKSPQAVTEDDVSEGQQSPQTLSQGFKKWKSSQMLRADEGITEQASDSETLQKPQKLQTVVQVETQQISQPEAPEPPKGKFIFRKKVENNEVQQIIHPEIPEPPENPQGKFVFRESRVTIKLEEKVEQALIQSSEMVDRHKQNEVEPEHLLMVMLWQPKGVIPQVLDRLNIPIDTVKREVRHSIMRFPNRMGERRLTVSPRLRFLLMKAQMEAERCGDFYISNEHILLALVSSTRGKRGSKRESRSAHIREAGDILLEWGVNQETVLSVFNEVGWIHELPTGIHDEDYGMPKASSNRVHMIRKSSQPGMKHEIREMRQLSETESLPISLNEESAPVRVHDIQQPVQPQTPLGDYWKQQMPYSIKEDYLIEQSSLPTNLSASQEDDARMRAQSIVADVDYLIWQTSQMTNPNEEFFLPLNSDQTEGAKRGNIIISTHKLCKNFGVGTQEKKVLKDLELDIYEGDFTVILGPDGAGKSMLLYTLSGMESPTRGTIQLFGKDFSELSYDEMVMFHRENCGFVFQKMCLLDNMSIMENILASCYPANNDRNSIREQAQNLLIRIGLNEEIWRRFPAQLSSEENQLGAVVRALINKPKVIFADEPMGALSPLAGEAVLDMLTDANNNGQSLIMVTQDLKSAMRGNRILYIDDGVIVGQILLGKYRKPDLRRKERLQGFLEEMEH